ncbi:mitochondrial fission ELM1 family protein [Aerosticca soli]|uniref:DUF1022 domain-containing protein n=1 Tax=Aerosticca soli TaxID=2010829 RepID=A0A2Z6E7N9_9GAMM|nr:mitochondrial fission ELM1 family protein [Aerosticca soli]MDI3263248.1 mitochondrial fission ELM1 family protein [Fulvimonas sp.]BBD81150.1 DUF1022 domain-containing protein [Aerosticca soli]
MSEKTVQDVATMPMCWVITDRAAGHQRQALALAGALGLPTRHLVLEPRAPWAWFAPRRLPGGRLALTPAARRLFAPPWPALAIGCGRGAALLTRLLGRLQPDCYRVQLLDPRIAPGHWDCVIAPAHDRLAGANVLTTLGALNPIDDDWLAAGRAAFPALAALPAPRLGVLLGGPRRDLAFDEAYVDALAARLRTWVAGSGGSLLTVASRRTPPALARRLRAALSALPGLHWTGAGDGPNPYQGVLGWADRLLVTPDSVSMLSEACAVGCPVASFAPAPLPAKLERLHRALRAGGHLGDLDQDRRVPPLREAGVIAQAVLDRFAARASPGRAS